MIIFYINDSKTQLFPFYSSYFIISSISSIGGRWQIRTAPSILSCCSCCGSLHRPNMYRCPCLTGSSFRRRHFLLRYSSPHCSHSTSCSGRYSSSFVIKGPKLLKPICTRSATFPQSLHDGVKCQLSNSLSSSDLPRPVGAS